jgi:hypothetical protein
MFLLYLLYGWHQIVGWGRVSQELYKGVVRALREVALPEDFPINDLYCSNFSIGSCVRGTASFSCRQVWVPLFTTWGTLSTEARQSKEPLLRRRATTCPPDTLV